MATPPWIVSIGLGLLGLTDAQQAEITGNTIPVIDDLVAIYNMNPALIARLVSDVNRAAPGIRIIMDALAAKNMNAGDLLQQISARRASNNYPNDI